ncbi:hypothetical protein SAMN05518672_104280 [Chitinophaga sp. CF118]|uniref:hypothetical protein n=1 Tax=Chitinophaga sp. CF118 TaxID=1884367 RepID=UPI0008DEFD4A|nr:hypothetical protein [Chitinophaga sp. CF118]SFE05222.1 hypothetical protein SAMN05518672_104280 [Chitinophaga sp. CF118]
MVDQNNEEESSWTTVLWTSIVALIGFGFAIYRYMQFSGMLATGDALRITRIELYIYRATGKWGIMAAFILMGIVGLYYTIYHIRAIRNRK